MSVSAGYIDLSKRRVSAEEVVKCEEKFAKAKCVSILIVCASDTPMRYGEIVRQMPVPNSA